MQMTEVLPWHYQLDKLIISLKHHRHDDDRECPFTYHNFYWQYLQYRHIIIRLWTGANKATDQMGAVQQLVTVSVWERDGSIV